MAIHILFDRPVSTMKVYDEFGRDRMSFPASGDAWGAKYGHDGPIPPGHYMLTEVNDLRTSDAPLGIVSEGPMQIHVEDMPASVAAELVRAHKAHAIGSEFSVGGAQAKIGQLAAWGRSEVMIHSGGSNAPDPFAARQQLCKTYGCTRAHTVDVLALGRFLAPALAAGQHVIFTVIGDSPALSC